MAMWTIYSLAVVICGGFVFGQECTNDTIAIPDFEISHVEYRNSTGNYPPITSCLWTFSGTNVTFQIGDIYIGQDDGLFTYDGASIASGNLIYSDTDGASANTKNIVVTDSGTVLVLFTSGPTILPTEPETGFDIYAIAGFDKSGFTDPSAGGEVNLTATTMEQVVSSPLFPEKYPKSATWKWNIRAMDAKSISVKITFLDIEKHASCAYDSIKVFNASDAGEKICPGVDWTTKRNYTFESDEVFIELVSDDFTPRHGFVAFYVAEFRLKELGEDCSVIECGTSNATCLADICTCEADFFQNGNVCETKKHLGEACANDNECLGSNVECNGTCQCVTDYVIIDNTCKLGLGGNCSVVPCAVPNAVCANNNTCVCDDDYYQSGQTCELKKGLGEECSSENQCMDKNATCACNKCTCQEDYVNISGVCLEPCHGDPDMIFCPNDNKCYCRPGMYECGGRCFRKGTVKRRCLRKKYGCRRVRCIWRKLTEEFIAFDECEQNSCPSFSKMICNAEYKRCRCKGKYRRTPCGMCVKRKTSSDSDYYEDYYDDYGYHDDDK